MSASMTTRRAPARRPADAAPNPSRRTITVRRGWPFAGSFGRIVSPGLATAGLGRHDGRMPVPGPQTLAETEAALQLIDTPRVDLRSAPLPPASETTIVTERGSFVRAHCPACGWSAPARRARAVADADADEHRAAGHGHRG
jgi:hypothetical protein